MTQSTTQNTAETAIELAAKALARPAGTALSPLACGAPMTWGRAIRAIAAAARRVVFLAAGLPLTLKEPQ